MIFKYYINYGSGDVEIHPVGTDEISFKNKRFSDQMFKRRELRGKVILQDDPASGYMDYTTLMAQDRDLEITFKVKRDCDDYVAIWWQGYFCIYDANYDEDLCTVSFSPTPDDAYRPFIDNWEKEYNILDLTGVDSIDIKETITPIEESMILQGDGLCSTPKYPESEIRQVYGVQWVFVGFIEDDSACDEWWVRYRLGFQPSEDWEQERGNYYYGTTVENYTFDVYYPNTRSVDDIITYIANDLGGLTYSSAFFSDATNPVSARPNTLKNLIIAQKSDFVGITSDRATVGAITVGDLFDVLKNIFQAYFYIDSGVLYFEHVRFFENSKSYEDRPALGLDLTLPANEKFIEKTYKYKFDRPEMHRLEKWDFMEAKNVDFVGMDMVYPQVVSNARGEDSYKKHSVDLITTDFEYVRDVPDDISLDGFLLLSCTDIQEDYPTDTTFTSWGVTGQQAAYETFNKSFTPATNRHLIYAVSTGSTLYKGAISNQFVATKNSTIKIDYNLTLISGSAPRIRLKTGSYYSSDLSEEHVFSVGSGTIEIRPTATKNAYLNIYNPKETTIYSLSLQVRIDSVEINSGVGEISGETFKNEPLSLARLQGDFWIDFRPAWKGYVNGSLVTFNAAKRMLVQEPFFIYECCDLIDYDKYVKTQIGVGVMQEADYNVADGTLDVVIAYYDQTNKNEGIGWMEIENTFIIG